MKLLLAAACLWLGQAVAQDNLAARRDALQSAIVKRDAATVSAMLRGGLAPDFNFDDLNKGRTSESPLTMTMNRDMVDIARLLIDAGANVNRRDGWGRGPIHSARSAEAAKFLAARGADVNAPDGNGRTAAVNAVAEGNLAKMDALRAVGASFDNIDLYARALEIRKPEMFDELLTRGTDPRKPPTRALWLLVESGDGARAKALIERGADPNARNDLEWLITRALFRQRWDIAEALVDAGANLKLPDAPGCGQSFTDCPPIQIARFASFNPALVKKLAAKGLDLNAAGADGHTAITSLIFERPMAIRVAPAQLPAAVGVAQSAVTGETRINAAPPRPQPREIPAADNAARIRALLEAGADANRKFGNATPLMIAVGMPERSKDIATALFEAGGRVEFDAAIPKPNSDERASGVPLNRPGGIGAAMVAGGPPGPMLERIAQPGSLVGNHQGEHTGMNIGPLTYTTLLGRPDIAVRLVQRERQVSRADRHLLYFAAAVGAWDVVTAALPYTKDANAANRAGVTPLMMAASAGQVEAVKALLAAGANVNARSASDWPPLLERSPLSLFAGHSPSRPHLVGGYTALRAASERQHAEVVKLLAQAGARP
jgi:ankyrin repeat protein